MTISVAIVGSGPAGFYTAEALLQSPAPAAVDIIERLPSPYGLIRAGVAPDHEKTRKVSRTYAQTAGQPPVHYYGNVEIGRDVSIEALREMYDAVVIAVGAPNDRKLGIPGEDKRNVFGSADFVGWYNGHPDFRDLQPELDTGTVAVIGNGNVAIDIARVLVRTRERLAETDIADYARAVIEAAPIRDVYLFGRRGPLEAKFTNVELREMGALRQAAAVVDPAQLPDAVDGEWSDRDRRLRERNLATLKGFAAGDGAEKPKRVHFVFYAAPVEILGGDRVTALRLERTRVVGGRAVGTGELFEVPSGLVVAAIGYQSLPIPGVPFDREQGRVANQDGRIERGFYVVGWAKRGPTGVIGTNKPDGKQAAEQIVADIGAGGRPGRAALERHLRERRVRWISWAEWQRIEAAEVAGAAGGAPRRKFTSIEEMLAVLE